MKRSSHTPPVKPAAKTDPSNWTVAQLTEYLEKHGVSYEDTDAASKEALVSLVSLHMTRGLSNPPKSVSLSLEVLTNPVASSVEELARHMSLPSYAASLRESPHKLEALLNLVFQQHDIAAKRYHPVSKWITDVCNGTDDGAAMQRALATEHNAVCGKHLTPKDVCFRCLTCAADPTCILCAECFKSSPCQNHEYRTVLSGGGMCDCGDPTAWRSESFCARHRGITEADDPTSHVDPSQSAWIVLCLRASVRLLLHIVLWFSEMPDPSMDEHNGTLVKAIAQRFSDLAKSGDCSRRFVTKVLCEGFDASQGNLASPPTATMTTSILDAIFKLDLNKKVSLSPLWKHVTNVVTQCVADPFLKVPVCRAILKSKDVLGEISLRAKDTEKYNKSLASLAVQVLTVPTVVDALLNPKRLDLGENQTIFHKMIASTAYFCVLLRDQKFSDAAPLIRLSPDVTDDSAFQISHQLIELKYALKASVTARSFFSASRLFVTAYALILQIMNISNALQRDTEAAESLNSWHIENQLANINVVLVAAWRHCVKQLVDGRTLSELPVVVQMQLREKVKCLPASNGNNVVASKIHSTVVERATVPPQVSGFLLDEVDGAPSKYIEHLLSCLAPRACETVDHLSADKINILDPDNARFTFTLPSVRIVASTMRLLFDIPQMNEASITQIMSSYVSSPSRWLDVVVMHFVALDQCRNDLWKRDHMGISRHAGLYERIKRGYTVEQDMFTVQLLSLVMTPNALASRVLQHFSYVPASDRLSKTRVPLGYHGFLRLMTTIVLDNAKLNPQESTSSYIAYHVRHLLGRAPQGLQRSMIQEVLKDVYSPDDDDDDDTSDEVLSKVLAETCTVERKRDGSVYRLKSADQFALLNPYCSLVDSNAYQTYIREYFNARRRTETGDLAQNVTAAPSISYECFPQHSAVFSRLRLLLHSEALQNVAAFTVLCAVVKEPDVPRLGTDPMELYTAIDVLYLVALDCCRITRETSKSVQTEVFSDSVDWDVVESFLSERTNTAVPSTTADASPPTAVYPLPQLVGLGSIYRKSHMMISTLNLSVIGRRNDQKLQSPLSLTDALLRMHAEALSTLNEAQSTKNTSRREENSIILHKLTFVLRVLGKLTEGSTAAPEASGAPSAQHHSEEKALKAKQRQKELMEKMKAKQQRAAAAHGAEVCAPQPNSEALCPENAVPASNLHAQCLVATTELECCFCQSDDDDALFYLCHFSSSSVHQSVGLLPQESVSRPLISAHTHMCGHAAHAKCVHRHHQHLESMRGVNVRQLLMSQRGFRGMLYLGSSEFSCPLCGRICTTLSAVPQISSTTTDDEEEKAQLQSEGSLSYFSEMHITASMQNFGELHECLLNAATGFSPSTDSSALFTTSNLEKVLEDKLSSALVTCVMNLNGLADAIRNEVLMVQCGRPVTFQRYKVLLSLTLSVSTIPRVHLHLLESKMAQTELRVDPLVVFLLKLLLEQTVREEDTIRLVCDLVPRVADGDRVISECSAAIPGDTEYAAAEVGTETCMIGTETMSFASMLWHTLALAFLCRSLVGGHDCAPFDEKDIFSTELRYDSQRSALQSLSTLARLMVPSIPSATALIRTLASRPFAVPSPTSAVACAVMALESSLVLSHIITNVLHLRSKYAHFLTKMADDGSKCHQCAAVNYSKPIICLGCDKLLCLQSSRPELYEHSRQCSGGNGIFLLVKATSLVVLQSVSGRAAQIPSVYVDKYGERDESMVRGAALTLSVPLAQEAVKLWLSASWDADTPSLQQSWRNQVEKL